MLDNKVNVLVAENDFFAREFIIQLLCEEEEVEIYEAKDGEEVLSFLFKNDIDFVIMDIHLPRKNGFEILKIIQRSKKFSSIPTIVFVANKKEKIRALEFGASSFLERPYNVIELKLKIANKIRLLKSLREKLSKRQPSNNCEIEIEKTQRELLLKLAIQSEKQMLFADNFKSLKIATYSKELSKLCSDLSNENLQQIYYAASFHNIGFISLPTEIKMKKGQYNQEERDLMQKHIKYGIEFITGLKNTKLLEVAKPVIEQYCERWDGLGYPQGLKGDSISFYARVVSLSVYFNAITSSRKHRDQAIYTNKEVYLLIKSQSKKRFDPILVDVLLKNFKKFINLRDKIYEKIKKLKN